MAESRDSQRSVILCSLTQIGPAKRVGYLRLDTIRNVLQMDPDVLARAAEANELPVALFGPDRCCIQSCALYLCHTQSLEALLHSSSSILPARRQPLDPDRLVARVAREWIAHAHCMAPVINRE